MTIISPDIPDKRHALTDGPRIHGSFLASPERWLLDRLVELMPLYIRPDHLTAIGVFGAFVSMAGFAASTFDPVYLWLVILGLAIHWFGDSMDGSLARARKIERPGLGFFIDQMVDVVTNLVIAVGVGLSPFVRMDVALLVLTGYHMLSLFTFIRKGLFREFRVDIGRVGPTEIRLGLVLICFGLLTFGAQPYDIGGLAFTWADAVLIVVFAGMLVMFAFVTIEQGRALNDPRYRKAWLQSTARLRRARAAKQRAKREMKSGYGPPVRPASYFPKDRDVTGGSSAPSSNDPANR
jgi:phosphatidylglycerophosphate synthase